MEAAPVPRIAYSSDGSCLARPDDALLAKVGEMGLEELYVFSVWHFDQFFTLLYRSQYIHALIFWALICIPGAALVYVAARTIRNMNFMEEEMKQQHENMMAEVTSLREAVEDFESAPKIQQRKLIGEGSGGNSGRVDRRVQFL